MLKNLVIIFGILILFCLGISAQERTWKTYTPSKGNWSILAPGTLTPDAEAAKSNSKRGSYSYNDSNGFFAVIYTDYSKLNIFPWKKAHYGKQRNLVMKANNASLVKDEEFTYGNITGREVRLRMPDNRTFARESLLRPQHRIQRFRMFFQGNRFYMILAVLPEEQISLPEIDKYFNSFTLK
ncbi:MAG: hypothetical protein AAB336_03705 [Acidobacteriota bacterium]